MTYQSTREARATGEGSVIPKKNEEQTAAITTVILVFLALFIICFALARRDTTSAPTLNSGQTGVTVPPSNQTAPTAIQTAPTAIQTAPTAIQTAPSQAVPQSQGSQQAPSGSNNGVNRNGPSGNSSNVPFGNSGNNQSSSSSSRNQQQPGIIPNDRGGEAPNSIRGVNPECKEGKLCPRGSKEKYTEKQRRMADHIEESYEDKGLDPEEAKKRAWATVNKQTGGGEKSSGGTRKPAAQKKAARKSSARRAVATKKARGTLTGSF